MSEDRRLLGDEIEKLRQQLEEQKGMLWLLGEMMKSAINITSFKDLISVVTDMLMGVMGVSNCYLWYKTETDDLRNYILFIRSTEQENQLRELKGVVLPKALWHIKATYLFQENEIKESLINDISRPKSRLVVPLVEVEDHHISGILVLEHINSDFFTPHMITFFETFIIFVTSKTQSSRLIQHVKEKSIKDSLTGIYNRRHLRKTLDYLHEKYEHVTVAVVDIDNFKNINDQLGHMQGDIVLRAIAQLAKGIVKQYKGEVIRYGGDEFIILIPKPLVKAIHILDEFRKSVPYLKIAYDLPIDISVTLGACAYPEMVQDYSNIIKIADSALLRGKVQGKNRVILASDEDIVLD